MPLRVGLISLEDKPNTVKKRVAAAMRHHRLTPEDIGGRLFLKGKGEIKHFKIEDPKFRLALIAWIKENKLDVVSIDPFVRTHRTPENDNVLIQKVVELYEQIAEQCNCAISLWHHTRKPKDSDSGASADNARGASSFVDACRSVRAIDNMSVKEAEQLNIKDRRSYFKSFSGKLNYAPATEKCDWYHLVNVELLNGPEPMPPSGEDEKGLYYGGNGGDHVGVVEAWNLPSLEIKDLSNEIIAQIKQALSSGNWRENTQATMWAGKAIAPIVNLNADSDKRQIKQLIDDLLFRKILKTIEGKRDGKDCLFVVPNEMHDVAPVEPTDGGRGKRGGISEAARKAGVSRRTMARRKGK